MSKSEEPLLVWKATKANGQPTHGSRALPLPKRGKPGAWHDTGRDPALCEAGVHGCRTLREMLVGCWLNEELWVAEIRGGIVHGDDKSAGRYGRLLYRVETWSDQTARLFAADCAEAAQSKDADPRSIAAIRAARRFAFGLIGGSELAAALDAARAAALDAAWDRQTLRLGEYLRGEVDLNAIRESVK